MWDLYGLEREVELRSREIGAEAAEMVVAQQATRGERRSRWKELRLRNERRRRNAERRPGGPLHMFAIVWYAVTAALFRHGPSCSGGAGKRGFHGGIVEKGE